MFLLLLWNATWLALVIGTETGDASPEKPRVPIESHSKHERNVSCLSPRSKLLVWNITDEILRDDPSPLRRPQRGPAMNAMLVPPPAPHRCSPSPTRCFTGLRSLCLVVPAGLAGGAYVDTPVKDGWLYVVKAKVFHEEEGAGAGDGAGAEVEGAGRKGSRLAVMTGWTAGRKISKSNVTTRLVLWDMRDGKEMSAPAVKTGEWEVGSAAKDERSLGVA